MDDQIYGNVDQRQSFDLDTDGVYANPEPITTTTQDENKKEGEKSTGKWWLSLFSR